MTTLEARQEGNERVVVAVVTVAVAVVVVVSGWLTGWLNTRGVLSTKLFLKARQGIIQLVRAAPLSAVLKLVNCFWHANETLVKRTGASTMPSNSGRVCERVPNPFFIFIVVSSCSHGGLPHKQINTF